MKKYLEELLKQELSDYSFNYEIEEDDRYWDDDTKECYSVKVFDTYRDGEYNRKKFNILTFILSEETKDSCKIEIELCEDCLEEIESFDRTIKYFWMSLLKF